MPEMVPLRAVSPFWLVMMKRVAVPATSVPVLEMGVELSVRASAAALPNGVAASGNTQSETRPWYTVKFAVPAPTSM